MNNLINRYLTSQFEKIYLISVTSILLLYKISDFFSFKILQDALSIFFPLINLSWIIGIVLFVYYMFYNSKTINPISAQSKETIFTLAKLVPLVGFLLFALFDVVIAFILQR